VIQCGLLTLLLAAAARTHADSEIVSAFKHLAHAPDLHPRLPVVATVTDNFTPEETPDPSLRRLFLVLPVHSYRIGPGSYQSSVQEVAPILLVASHLAFFDSIPLPMGKTSLF